MTNSNIQSEKLLLSGFMRNPDSFLQFVQHLSADDFTAQAAKMIWECIYSLILHRESRGLSPAKITSEARALGYQNFFKATRDGEALEEMFAEQVSKEEISQHFLEVKRHTLMRAYERKMREVSSYLSTTSDPLSDIISTVENTIISAVSAVDCGEIGVKRLTEGLKDFVFGMANQPGQIGLDLGFNIWQSMIGQIRKPSVTYVVSTAKGGKSQFGLRSGLRVAHKLGLPVLLIDTELSESDQKTRAAGMLSQVPYDVIETGFWQLSDSELRGEGLNDEQIRRMLEYQRRMKSDDFWETVEKLPIEYISVAGKTLDDVLPHMKRWVLTKVKPNPDLKVPQCLIIYDYLKLANMDELRGGRVQEWQIHGLNYNKLHTFAKGHDIPILCFGQTNQQSQDDQACIAGAKRISENVTSASILRAKTEEELAWDPQGSHLIRVFMTRHGRGKQTSGYINVGTDLSMGHFEELGLGTVNFEERRRQQLEDYQNRRRNRGRRPRDDDDDDD